MIQTFHIAVESQVLSLSDQQQARFGGIRAIPGECGGMNASGTFQPSTPPPAAKLPHGPLNGTVEVSLGSFRVLNSVAASQTGLPLPGIGNFEGRIDLGFVIDRSGNFGLAITLRGPISDAPKGVASTTRRRRRPCHVSNARDAERPSTASARSKKSPRGGLNWATLKAR